MARGVILALISASCYGLGPILFKLCYAAGLGTLDILTYRFVFAAALLFLFLVVVDRRKLRVDRDTLLKATLAGLGVYLPESFCFISAVERIPVATNSLIFYFYPLTVTLLSIPVFKLRLKPVTALALVVILAGGTLISSDAVLRGLDPVGLAFSLASMLLFSVYLLLVQACVKRCHPLTFTLYVFLAIGLGMTGVHGLSGLVQATPRQLVLILLVGLVPTTMAVPLLYASIERIGGALASIISSFELVVTVIVAALALGEHITAHELTGMACILAGVALPNLHLLRLMGRRGAG